jgi:cytochrome c peroxidase
VALSSGSKSAAAIALIGIPGVLVFSWVESAFSLPESYVWRLPAGFPLPLVPADNPMSDAKVELGRALFFDRRLSVDGSMSCASCHQPEKAFTDGRPRSIGATGEVHPRGAPSLANVAYSATLTWDDPFQVELEEQLLTPIFGHDPIELGMARSETLLAILRADLETRWRFAAAFPEDEQPITLSNLAKAIAAFERTLISGNAPFDRSWYQGDSQALSEPARLGMKLFFSRRLSCSECHARVTFSGPIVHQGAEKADATFHNNGLYNLGSAGSYPPDNPGLSRFTDKVADRGRFRAPTLRNIAVTAPYMHDGSIATLDEVIAHYETGGRTIASGPNQGIGRDNPNKSPLVRGFSLTAEERRALIAFLESLTDEEFLREPRFADPARAMSGG